MLPHVPIAAVGPAIPAFAIIAFLLYLDVGLGLFGVYRSGGDGAMLNVGVGLAIAAAALAIFSVFQPAFQADGSVEVIENTLIQRETGWLILACGVGIIGAACHALIRRTASCAVLILGLAIYGTAVYQANVDQPATDVMSNLLGFLNLFRAASPGAGLYAAGAAGLLAIYAGLIIGSPNLWIDRRRALPRR